MTYRIRTVVLLQGGALLALLLSFATATAQRDAGRIAYVSGSFNADLYSIEPEGQPERLTDTAGVAEAAPDWAPDGETLAYVAPRDDGPVAAGAAVWLRDPEGESRALSFGPLDLDPDWHPAGDRVIYGSVLEPGEAAQTSVLMVASLPDALEQRPLLAPLQRPDAKLAGPAWSPDGSRVAFVLDVAAGAKGVNDGGEIYIAQADGTGAGVLLPHPGWDDIEPAWSPDGTRLAFASGHMAAGAAQRHGLWLIDLRSGAFGELLADPRLDLRHPTWSPDGSRLAFEAREPGAARGRIHITPWREPALRPDAALAEGGAPDWSRPAFVAATATSAPPTPTPGPSPTPGSGPAPSVTPPGGGPPGVPTVPPLAPFPTLPPAEPTMGPDAPPFPMASPTPQPSATPTASVTPTASATPSTQPGTILLPYLARTATLRDEPTP